MDYITKLKRALKVKRTERGIDYDKDYAALIGWSSSNYHNRMTNFPNLKLCELERMADVLNCDLKIELVEREE